VEAIRIISHIFMKRPYLCVPFLTFVFFAQVCHDEGADAVFG
jgi:hypothetical protein